MQISISSIKDRQGATLPFDFTMSPSEFYVTTAEGVQVMTPVRVDGKVTNTGESMLVKAKASGRITLHCSRCLQPVESDVEAEIEERYRRLGTGGPALDDEDELADEDDVGYYERDRIDLGEVVRENFALQIPMKSVCNDACRGLCPQCGINLNVESCSCRPDDTDPRLAVLREWQARHHSDK